MYRQDEVDEASHGQLLLPRSGHSATVVNGGEDVVVFGGLHTSNFIGETVVLAVRGAMVEAAVRGGRRPGAARVSLCGRRGQAALRHLRPHRPAAAR